MARPSCRCQPTIGFLHTGIEKTAEQKKWQQVIPLVERMDYLGAQSNSLAFCLSVEKMLGLERCRSASSAIRVLIAELQRISSHLVWFGTHAMEIGAITGMLYAFREREILMNLNELLGRLPLLPELHPRRRPARGHPARLQGSGQGVPRSVPRQARRIRDADHQEPDLAGSHARRRRDHATRTAASGACSARSRAPPAATTTCAAPSRTCGYDTYEFDVIGASNGDVYDRYLTRVAEMRESVKICQPGARAHRRRSARGRATTSASCRRPRTRSTRRWKR